MSLAGQQRGALLESLSRVLPSGLARRVLAAPGDADRQRIERDLHDGVQQRLTGLRIRLALAAQSFQERGDTDASAALNGLGRRSSRPSRRSVRSRGVSIRCCWPPKDWVRHWPQPAVRGSAGHGVCTPGTPLPARGRERGLLHLPRGDRQCRQARRTGRGLRACLGYPPSCELRSATPAAGLTRTRHRAEPD